MTTRLAIAIVIAACPSLAGASTEPVDGSVTRVTSRWAGDVIVSEADVATGGETVSVIQLGGVVDGIGMTFTHTPHALRAGEAVSLRVTAAGVVVAATPAISRVTGGTATYGVQRTIRSNVPLWRDDGCLAVTYDERSIDPVAAGVLDAAFDQWVTATTSCAGLAVFTDRREARAARDGRDTIQILRDRWCRAATATEPELCYAPSASAVTRLVFVDDPTSPDDGKILEADVELDAVHFELLAPGAPSAGVLPALDLQSVATHEIGHVLGLAHSCATGDEPWPVDHAGNEVPSCDGLGPGATAFEATMYFAIEPGEFRARDVEVGDVGGACATLDRIACSRAVTGGCQSGRGSSWVAIVVVVALLRRSAK